MHRYSPLSEDENVAFFQLVTQCNAKYVECFSAQKGVQQRKELKLFSGAM